MEMNKRTDRITEEVRKTMEVLDGLPDLEAHYLFRARLMETVSRTGPTPAGKLSNAAYGLKLALVALLLAINIGTAMLFMGPDMSDSEPAFSRNDMLESLKNDYGSPVLSYYTENDGNTAENDE